ncbi:lactate racemase domain-containing protein [Aneurinibacillus tyrosinisolvens]|uniref:lactate racemase domain-containing protein n=1 Tax=Aneurinibacillus tyrosinisolvens TaxID=1443435 RepID=UPI000B25F309|nr:lactate racemase domain-containing protein [Aneurinibacillus tyrosinisolvens]
MKFPKVALVKQRFRGPAVQDIDKAVSDQLAAIGLADQITPGMRIAITAGSRGIANIAVIIRATVHELKKLGAAPFIVPTMGSHGGATAEGQVEVLESLGVTEAFCGAPIQSSMEVVHIGETPAGMPVHVDKNAWEADGIVLMGRVKVHTDFKSPIHIESGLMKMAAIGLGKHKQALLIHSYGVHGIRDIMPEVAQVMLDKAKIICGVALIENAFEQTAKIEAIPTASIPEREKELLKESALLCLSFLSKILTFWSLAKSGKITAAQGWTPTSSGAFAFLEWKSRKHRVLSTLSQVTSVKNPMGTRSESDWPI